MDSVREYERSTYASENWVRHVRSSPILSYEQQVEHHVWRICGQAGHLLVCFLAACAQEAHLQQEERPHRLQRIVSDREHQVQRKGPRQDFREMRLNWIEWFVQDFGGL